MMFTVSFDPGSLEALARLAGFGVLLNPNIQASLTEAGTLLTNAAVANTWQVFANPTGELASTIYPWLVSPSQMEIRAGSPYGRRREEGFSGMTDSLGRTYTNDPGKPYMRPALDDNAEAVKQLIAEAVQVTLTELGV